MNLLPWLIMTFLFGACVGSFLNVVIYRLPLGKSLVSPPSHCPACDHKLAPWDNVPIFGWLWLKGKCRYCKIAISPQYPLIELITALLFCLFFACCYYWPFRPDFQGPVMGGSGMIFIANLLLIAGLLASTIIDARLFIIPLQIPWFVSAAALVLIPLAVAFMPESVQQYRFAGGDDPVDDLPSRRMQFVPEIHRDSIQARAALAHHRPGFEISPAPIVSSSLACAALAGSLGLLLSLGLLRAGIFKVSFADPPKDQPPATAATAPASHPAPSAPAPAPAPGAADPSQLPEDHFEPRKEIVKEIIFLLPPMAAFFLALAFAPADWITAPWLRAAGGVLAGYLIGGAVVWVIRILGTLGFGKEAMGLGDMHLMAAVGAVAGWKLAVLAFFLAPFSGVIYALATLGMGRIFKLRYRAIPYGPHLALASFGLMLLANPAFIYLLVNFRLG